jgi:hypothetical protein
MKQFIFLLFISFLSFSCGNPYKEISPEFNPDSLKVKFEIISEKSSGEHKGEFVLKFINTGKKDLARCSIKIDNKYEHIFEGLIDKSDDYTGKLTTSLLEENKSVTLVFSDEIDNFSIFGIKDENYSFPQTIELMCLDGKVIWKFKQ